MSRTLDPRVNDAIAAQLGPLSLLEPAAGGSIADAYFATAFGRAVFIKTHARLPAAAFAREAEGLGWLRASASVLVPEVLAVSADDDDGPGFLVLERIPLAGGSSGVRERDASDEAFGRELALLHRCFAPACGLERDNFLATLPQDNAPASDWPTFYQQRRLAPLARLAEQRGLFPRELRRKLDRLAERIAQLTGPTEPPSRLHGDLWGGNRVVAKGGRSFVIDPAVYAGHREIDLAMMQLFGGFSARVFAAYDEVYPRAQGHERRVPLNQLYPLLAHLVMFGAGYLGDVEAALDASISSG